jgi:queuine tRNA-ribosyltransferase
MTTENYPEQITIQGVPIRLPAFLPDATFGVVRSVDSNDLLSCQVQAVMMNSFHLMQKPGSSTVQALGGLHRMSAWEKPIFTDSGGFQAYSLIRQVPNYGKITDKGLSFTPEGSGRKYQLTPEKSIQLQMSYDANVVICLDDCTHVNATYEEQKLSVTRTIDWARLAKTTYNHLLEQKKIEDKQRPLIFAVIQGGGVKDLRKQCAESLLEIGFDGFGFGGWPLDADSNLLEDILAYTRSLVPPSFPMHALGIGHPDNLLSSYEMGYGLFDSAMPTRDARHGRLYVFTESARGQDAGLSGEWKHYLYINDESHIKSGEPVSPYCDCLCCQHYSRGYLRHLFKMGDTLFYRLATIHNLRFMTQLTERIRMRDYDR